MTATLVATTFAVMSPNAAMAAREGAELKAPTATVMINTQRMSDATLQSTQAGWYTKGSKLSLTCYKRGQAVKGFYSSSFPSTGGYDDLWYKVSDGYYVADVDINTGSLNPVTGACTSGSSLSAKVDAFVAKWLGKAADYDGAYGAQCVDLFNFYNRDVVGARKPAVSYAYQLYDTYDTAKYTRLSASTAPQKGDVAVFASNLPYSGGAGHVAIVLGTSGSSLVVLQQNWAGHAYVTKNTSSKSYLRGYLRPKA